MDIVMGKKQQSFTEKHTKDESGGCWDWVGSTMNSGYGQFWNGRKMVGAHRHSFEMHNDMKLTPDVLVLHKCDNRLCVNPAHLFLGTHQSNSNDMMAKGRQQKGVDRHNAKLSEDQVLTIRGLYARGECDQDGLSSMFNVRQSCISKIINYVTWKHI